MADDSAGVSARVDPDTRPQVGGIEIVEHDYDVTHDSGDIQASAAGVSPMDIQITTSGVPVVGQPLAISVTLSLIQDSLWWPIDAADAGARGEIFVAFSNEFKLQSGAPSDFTTDISDDTNSTRIVWHNELVPLSQPLTVSVKVLPMVPTGYSQIDAAFGQRGTQNGASSQLYAGVGQSTGDGYVSEQYTVDIDAKYRQWLDQRTPTVLEFEP